MATLADADYGETRASIYQFGAGKEELKALGSLPSQDELKAALQSLEDNVVSALSVWKADIDTELGVTTTNPLAQKIIAGFLAWKIDDLLGA